MVCLWSQKGNFDVSPKDREDGDKKSTVGNDITSRSPSLTGYAVLLRSGGLVKVGLHYIIIDYRTEGIFTL